MNAVITDCSSLVEMGYQRDGKVPVINYELELIDLLVPNSTSTSTTTHLGADEMTLTGLDLCTLAVSSVIALSISHCLSHGPRPYGA